VNCQEANRIFFRYVDHELSLPEEKALFAHLLTCDQCSSAFSSVRDMHNLIEQAMTPVAPPANLTERIMAAIPKECFPEEGRSSIKESGLRRMVGRWADFFRNWKESAGWQFKAAAVSLGLLAVVVWGSHLNFQGTELAKIDSPGVDPGYVSSIDNKEDPPDLAEPNKPAGEKIQAVENNNDLLPSASKPEETGEREKDQQKPDPEPPAKDSVQVPDVSDKKDVIELPHATSGQDRVDSVEILPLVLNSGEAVSRFVIAEGGDSVHYLVSPNGETEEWQVELKKDAEPQKVEADFLIDAGSTEELDPEYPEWLYAADLLKNVTLMAADWSPNKTEIAVNIKSSETEDVVSGVWIIKEEGKVSMQAAQVGGGEDVAWSPDGLKIAFTDELGCLYVTYLSENLMLQITDSSDGFAKIGSLSWTPDAKKIVFSGEKQDQPGTGIFMVALP